MLTASPHPLIASSPYLLLILFSLPLHAASLQTRDGQTHTGAIQFLDNKIQLTPKDRPPLLFDLPSITRLTLDPPPPKPPTTLPAQWSFADVGRLPQPGRASIINLRFTLFDASPGLADPDARRPHDAFHFVYKPLPTDGELIALLLRFPGAPNARAGLIARETLDPDSPFVMLARAPNASFTTLLARSEKGRPPAPTAEAPKLLPNPVWLRLVRTGDTLLAYESPNARQWTLVGQQTLPTPLHQPLYIGLAAPTQRPNNPNPAVFDRVRLTATPPDLSRHLPPGLLTRSSSLLACQIVAADPTTTTYRLPATSTPDSERSDAPDPSTLIRIPTHDLSRLIFRPLSPELSAKLDASPAGVLLTNGDFLEGTLKSLNIDQLTLDSVLFGLKTFDLPRSVAALSLRPATPPPSRLLVKLTDHSLLHPTSLQLRDNHLHLTDPLLGPLTLPPSSLLELHQP